MDNPAPASHYETPSRNSQTFSLLAILYDELQTDWSYRDNGGVFEVSKATVHRVRPKAMNDIEHDTGRPPLLQPAEEPCLIADRFQGGSAVSPKQVRGYAFETFKK
jgi:hypothetical protein